LISKILCTHALLSIDAFNLCFKPKDCPMTDKSLLEVLTLRSGSESDEFIGTADAYGVIGIYGGHFLGQGLAAAFKTIDDDKLAHSLHAYFLKTGKPGVPISYRVERNRDGRGFASRTIKAFQNGQQVFAMMVSFKLFEPGDEHQKTMPIVPSAAELIAKREAANAPKFPFPMTLNGRVDMEWASESFRAETFVAGREPHLRNWMRANVLGIAKPSMNQCMLAFLSDGTMMFNAALPHGIPFETHRLTSLDQALWFHRNSSASDWLLFDQRSTAAADSRGMNEGEIYNQAGELLMTVAQESMLRRLSVTTA
jgi:acyl-CoA thioesterase-2